MNNKLKRLSRVLSCFIVAAVVLLASVIMPVYAAAYNLYPVQDMLTGVVEAGGFKTATFDIYSGNLVPSWNIRGTSNQGFDTSYTFSETYNYALEMICSPFEGITNDIDHIDISTLVDDYEDYFFNSSLSIKGSFGDGKHLSLSGSAIVYVFNKSHKILNTYSVPLEFTQLSSGDQTCDVHVPFKLTSDAVSINCSIKIYGIRSKFNVGDTLTLSVSGGELIASKPYFISAVTDAYGSILDWVGTVLNALVGDAGSLRDLLPLLAVGVAVYALILGYKVIKSIVWGR